MRLQLVQECTGYEATRLLPYISVSVLWRLTVRFKPEWAVRLLQQCPQHRATWVLVKVCLHSQANTTQPETLCKRSLKTHACCAACGWSPDPGQGSQIPAGTPTGVPPYSALLAGASVTCAEHSSWIIIGLLYMQKQLP